MNAVEVSLEGFSDITFEDLWPRTFKQSQGEAYCGAEFVVTITRPFTVSEDQVFLWVLEQDSVQLYGILHLKDGRDMLLFQRQFTKQTKAEAEIEHRQHLMDVLSRHSQVKLPMQHGTPATR